MTNFRDTIKVLVIRFYDDPLSDPRLLRHILILKKVLDSFSNNYVITILSPSINKSNSQKVKISNGIIHFKVSIPSFRMPKIFEKILKVIILSLYSLFLILSIRPQIIYTVNIDGGLLFSLIPYKLSKILIYDCYDYYFLFTRNKIMYRTIYLLEYKLSKKSDLIIVPFRRIPAIIFNDDTLKNKHLTIANMPILFGNLEKINKIALSKFRSLYNNNKKIIIYVGSINKIRGINIILNIASTLSLKVFLAGNITDEPFVLKIKKLRNVIYLGKIKYQEALALQYVSRFIIALYDPLIPIHRLADPNKIYEGALLLRPIITNIKPHDAVKDCTLVVQYDEKSLFNIIKKLIYDEKYYNTIINQCKKSNKALKRLMREQLKALLDEYNRLLLLLINQH